MINENRNWLLIAGFVAIMIVGLAIANNGGATNVDSANITNSSIQEEDLKSVDSAIDEECLTYEATIGDFEWQTCGEGSFADSRVLVYDVQKGSPGTLNIGEVVYITGFDNGADVVEVELADSSSAATMPGIGIMRSEATIAVSGEMVGFGRLINLNTSSYSEDDPLYVSEVAGELTDVAPTGTALVQQIAIVARSHATDGRIGVVGAGRANELPNLADDNVWLGSASGVSAETVIPPCDTNILARIQYTVATNSFACEQANNLILPGYLTVSPTTRVYFDSGTHTSIRESTNDVLTFTIGANDQYTMEINQFRMAQSGSAAAPAYAMGNDIDTGMYRVFANTLGFATGGNEAIRIDTSQNVLTSNGNLFVSDTSNANMTQGTTINQGASDNEIFALKSTDVGHGVTGITELDTFGLARKAHNTNGGFRIEGYGSGTTQSLVLFGRTSNTSVDTSDDSSSVGVIRIAAEQGNGGTGTAALDADDNLLSISNSATTVFLIKGNGDIHTANTTLIALDEYDDIAMLRDLRLCMAAGNDEQLNTRYGNLGAPIDYTCNELVNLGLLTADPPARIEQQERFSVDDNGEIISEWVEIEIDPIPLFSLTSTTVLIMDALRTYAESNNAKMRDLESRILTLEK